MNEPNTQNDWQKRLQELEAEVNESSEKTSTEANNDFPSSVRSNSPQLSSQAKKIATQVRQWFDQLPVFGKVIVGAVGVGISLSLLKTVFQLVTSVLTLAIIGALGYVGYQVFIASKNNPDQ